MICGNRPAHTTRRFAAKRMLKTLQRIGDTGADIFYARSKTGSGYDRTGRSSHRRGEAALLLPTDPKKLASAATAAPMRCSLLR